MLNMIKLNKCQILGIVAILLSFAITSCTNDDPAPINIEGKDGFFIVNEGAFRMGNSSLSFYDRKDEKITNNIFMTTNKIPLGDQAQSLSLSKDKNTAYVIVQNSSKVEIMDANDFTSIETLDTVDGIRSPRYMITVSETKGYISDWGSDGVSGTIKVLNLMNNEIEKSFSIGKGPENFLQVDDKVYVVNSGGWGKDSTVQVININSDKILQTLKFKYHNPNSLVEDVEGNIWVAFSGHTTYDPTTFEVVPEKSTNGVIVKINSNGEVLPVLASSDLSGCTKPSRLSINNDKNQIYYLCKGKVHKIDISNNDVSTITSTEKSYYGFSYDPFNENIVACESPNFTSSGNIDIYDPKGAILATFSVGIGPSGCVFK